MSLDVLLEAADVLEKQKVASILTSMHQYDKNFKSQSPEYSEDSHSGKSDDMDYSPTHDRRPNRLGHPDSANGPQSGVHSDPNGTQREVYAFNGDSDPSRNRCGLDARDTWETRSIHNQMEKNRRAQLRVYMNNLRDVIPCGPNRRKLTTLTLLQNARAYIESLKEHEEEYEHDKQKLWRRHLRLREFLCQLAGKNVLNLPGIPTTPSIRREVSENTNTTNTNNTGIPTAPSSNQPMKLDEKPANGGGGLSSLTCDEELPLTEGDMDEEKMGEEEEKRGPGDTASEMSESDSIGTFSNSDGGETVVSPDKDL